ncbi:MAG: SCO family protein [Phenylobacterium sp.]|uniref:SCO family protein n=1 Tax=Phenylobacterium sp. TaxID=1871053 RepID=UPI00271C5058|nr:SCO family protein [Phenylobacterium sp.]MDO8911150.1 SCO family protein [Phenylobacterium sp.]MDP3102841.1 SCO family protein [Phenylobacterium sp.]
MTRRNLIVIAACVLGLILGGALAWKSGAFKPAPATQVGGPFQLVDQTGKPVTEAVLKGKWSVVFFGFTYCPDVCPSTLQAMGLAQERLGAKAKDVQFVFISVDPERDTPAQMATYLDNDVFPKGTIGLTGAPAQAAAAAKAYRVFYEKQGTGADYLINHSTPSYLMNPQGRFDRVLPFGIGPDEIVTQISAAMRE